MEPIAEWPYGPTLLRLALALGIGLFVGLERERRGKEAGVRTFAFVALSGALGGLLGQAYTLISLALVGLLTIILALETWRAGVEIEVTTSAALFVVCFAGALAGMGHTFTPVAVGIISAALLAWKERLVGLGLVVTEDELRSAILLAILSFIVYPALPNALPGPWISIDLRSIWFTVILIAGIGFANYILLKLYGRRGVEIGGFLSGLVNSSVAITDLVGRVRDVDGLLVQVVFRATTLATLAMLVRNAFLVGILDHKTLLAAAFPLAVMMVTPVAMYLIDRVRGKNIAAVGSSPLRLESPFSLSSVLKFGLIFLALQIAGVAAERVLGQFGFYFVSVIGGFVSSASAVSSAATLAAHGEISPTIAGTGVAIASICSVLVNVPLIAHVSTDRRLTRQAGLTMALTVISGVIAVVAQLALPGLSLTGR